MKKIGFTISEIIITLGIIGVISALTLPAFLSNNKEKMDSAKLNATINAFENAFGTLIANEAASNLSETSAAENLFESISDYMQVVEVDKNYYSTKTGAYIFTKDKAFVDGMLFVIDTNGFENKPNKIDVDQYEFILKDTGFLEKKDEK